MVRQVFAVLLVIIGFAGGALAADRAEMRRFLEVTGFDVAITSMRESAKAGPALTGDAANTFAHSYEELVDQIFVPEEMLGRALDMMEAVMPAALVEYGIGFYGSDLGQRLVAVENASHMTPDAERMALGEEIVAQLMEANPARIKDYRAMQEAIGGTDTSLAALIEIQLRYIMAADAARGEQTYSEDELRTLLMQSEPQMRAHLDSYALVASAYAYRDIPDADIKAYREVLESDEMRQVYEILNAVQNEIMAERYETLAAELAKLPPVQSL
ncbi:MAG: hypothetical protein CR993_02175 [Rhodobacterales bacterium]|nr:MAG: hypothetical protein CR993_02175 [Rhodobacterales bacterium]